MSNLKVIVEKHEDGYVAYPLGLKGVVVGQGDTYDEALADVRSEARQQAVQARLESNRAMSCGICPRSNPPPPA
jgi:predicted RNase H-like HicB family nuclease